MGKQHEIAPLLPLPYGSRMPTHTDYSPLYDRLGVILFTSSESSNSCTMGGGAQ